MKERNKKRKKEYIPLGCDALYSGRYFPTFRGNLVLQFSALKYNLSSQQIAILSYMYSLNKPIVENILQIWLTCESICYL
jgi:hypothetical protein